MNIALLLAALLADPLPEGAPPVPHVQWYVFQLEHCLPCRKAERDFRPWFERAPANDKGQTWLVSPVPWAHVRLIDAECDTELAEKFNIAACPCFVLLVDGKEVERPMRTRIVKGQVVEEPFYPGREYMARRLIEEVGRLK